mgnify:CR=1 FL=1
MLVLINKILEKIIKKNPFIIFFFMGLSIKLLDDFYDLNIYKKNLFFFTFLVFIIQTLLFIFVEYFLYNNFFTSMVMFILSIIMFIINQLDLRYYQFLAIINVINLVRHIYLKKNNKDNFKIKDYINKHNICFFFILCSIVILEEFLFPEELSYKKFAFRYIFFIIFILFIFEIKYRKYEDKIINYKLTKYKLIMYIYNILFCKEGIYIYSIISGYFFMSIFNISIFI